MKKPNLGPFSWLLAEEPSWQNAVANIIQLAAWVIAFRMMSHD